MWAIYACGSAFFAALTAVLAKIGIDGVNSNLATAIRTVFVLIMAWIIVLFTGNLAGVREISRRSWMFLALSGLATGASWLCYYRALQTGPTAPVVTIDKFSLVLTILLAALLLREMPSGKTLLGAALVTAGTLIIALA